MAGSRDRAAARWRIELLGGLRATREGAAAAVTRFRTHKAEALLGALAYHRDRPQPRELLVAMLWPESAPELGRNNLSRELSSLRQLLEPPGVAAGSVIVAGRTTIQLDPGAVSTDVAELDAAVASAGRARGPERLAHLRAAIALPAGELLPGHYQDWIEPERGRLRRVLEKAGRELAAELERAGDLAGARDALERAARADPLSEETHRALMALHAKAGEPGRALRVFEDFAATLERELTRSPAAATAELARAIRATASGSRAAEGERAFAGASARSGASPAAPARAAASLASVLALAFDEESSSTSTSTSRGAGSRTEAAAAVARHDGRKLEAGADGIVLAAFARPADALACALAVARGPGARVRAALDTGVVGGAGAGESGPVARARALARVARPGSLLVSERTAPLLGLDLGPGLALEDLGRYAIAGEEERLFRVEGAGLRADEPDARRVQSAALPLELTSFFGREGARRELQGLLQPGGARVVTLTGPGGIGKTRLALELARELEGGRRGAVWFVPLESASDPARVLEAIAGAMRLDRASGDRLDDVTRALDGRDALLVLDNLEQLGDEAARVVRDLLGRAPRLACLATSRRRLGLPGEHELALGPLPVPSGGESAGELAAYASVQLFLDRARAVRPDLELGPGNAASVGELVRRLEGIPLALVLAAGRAQALSPGQILERLGERFALLRARSPDVPERHRTLSAALEWSTQLLPEETRLFFSRLAVFRGPFTLEAAEAVTREALALDALSELRECSLVAAGSGPGGAVLFRLLETIRELADDGLAPDERAQLELRHAEHYRALASAAETRLHGPGGGEWFRRLSAEYANLRAVLERAARTPALAGAGLALARALRSYWFGAGPLRDVAALVPPLLAAAPARTADRAAVLWALGLCHARLSTVDRARAPLEESLGIWLELDDVPMATGVVLSLGEALSRAGEDAAARSRYAEGLALARAAGDVRRLGWGLGAFAQHLVYQDELALARPLVEESVALHEALDAPQHALEQRRLAEVLLGQGESARADELATRALETFRRLGFESGVPLAQALLGRIRAGTGGHAEARALLGEALAAFRKGDRPDGVAQALCELAEIELAASALASNELAATGPARSGLARAREHLDEAARVVRGTCEHLFVDRLELVRGEVARALGEPAAAREHYRAALAHVRTRRGWNRGSALRGALEGLALVEARPRPELAARLAGAAAALRERRAPPPPARRRELDALVEELRGRLGLAFDRTFAEGRALPDDAALEAALAPGPG